MKKMLWVDVETTGLNIDTCLLLQIGAFVTNEKLEIENEFEACISGDFIKTVIIEKGYKWDAAAYQMHKKNGLVDQLQSEEALLLDYYHKLDAQFCEFILDNDAVNLPIAGRNPGFDRKFLEKLCPQSAMLFHSHFNFDVRTLKLLMPGDFFPRHDYAHTALADIRHDLDDARALAFRLDLI